MQKLNVFDAQQMALEYFNSIKPTNTVSGFTRYIATDGEHVLIVPQHFNEPTAWVFKCEIRNNETYIELVN